MFGKLGWGKKSFYYLVYFIFYLILVKPLQWLLEDEGRKQQEFIRRYSQMQGEEKEIK